MAKQRVDQQDSGDTYDIAKSLFLSTFRPRSGVDAWMVAVDCFRSAATFRSVADKIASGMTPDDVIAEQQLQEEQEAASLADVATTE